MTENVQFHGFEIPKGTLVFANLFAAHHDPAVWGDPANFRPERFLTANGKGVVKHDGLIPFSTGKRVCLGESLARDTLFLFITSLVHTFDVRGEEGEPMPSLEVKYGQLTLTPLNFCSVVMKERA
jgi:cytochrome P450